MVGAFVEKRIPFRAFYAVLFSEQLLYVKA
jgi:hypothetical protein